MSYKLAGPSICRIAEMAQIDDCDFSYSRARAVLFGVAAFAIGE
jgi:hypothetical protein